MTFTAQEFGMTEEAFESAKVSTRVFVESLMRDGGFSLVEKTYLDLKMLDKYQALDGLGKYRLAVLANILVMA